MAQWHSKVSPRFFLAITLFVLPNLLAIATMREVWPFSNYPMFSKFDDRRQMNILRLRATTVSGGQVWLSGYRELFPLGPQCLNKLVALKRRGTDRQLKQVLEFYKNKAVEISGEPIDSIHLDLNQYRFDESWNPMSSSRRTLFSSPSK